MSTPQLARDAVPLAEIVRGDLVEVVYVGHAVILDAQGNITTALGNSDVVIYPRSANKPFQATAALRHGLDLPTRLLALAASSHGGDAVHRDGVRQILASQGLHEQALRNTPDFPLHPATALEWQKAGLGKSSVAQCCSGKHSAMVVTSAVNGWDLDTYLDPDHPIQQAGLTAVTDLTGVVPPCATTDGCGAVAAATTLTGLARGYARVAAGLGTPDDALPADADRNAVRVGRAMRAFPEMVAGPERPVTKLMVAIPSLLFKDGADGAIVGAFGDGRSFAAKIGDGSGRPFLPVAVRLMELMGGILDAPDVDREAVAKLREEPIYGGAATVGSLRASF